MNNEFISTASKLIEQGRLSEAAVILRQALRKRPADWSPIVESEDREIVHSWDRTEFLAYVEHRKRSGAPGRSSSSILGVRRLRYPR